MEIPDWPAMLRRNLAKTRWELVRSLKSAPASAVQNFIFSISYFQAARLLGRDVTSATRQRTSLA